jgi:hypothetical protein
VKAAVVLMAYGSPERLADVPAYYSDIRGGRAIPPELLADLVERYRRLGIEDGRKWARTAACRATSIRRFCSAPGRESSPRPALFSRVLEGGRVMYSTLGTECHPIQTRPFSGA